MSLTLQLPNEGDVGWAATVNQNFSAIQAVFPVGTGDGGTGNISYSLGDLLYASATTTLSRLAVGSADQVLQVRGGIPTWVSPLSLAAASGTNIAGTNLAISSGQSTGNASGGSIIFKASAAGSSGTGVNGLSTILTIDSTGNVFPASASASALGKASTGFKGLYLDYTNTSTVGNVTINKPSGRVIMPAASNTLTVTNSLVTAASRVFAIPNGGSAGCPYNVLTLNGSFQIVSQFNPGSNLSYDFLVINAD